MCNYLWHAFIGLKTNGYSSNNGQIDCSFMCFDLGVAIDVHSKMHVLETSFQISNPR